MHAYTDKLFRVEMQAYNKKETFILSNRNASKENSIENNAQTFTALMCHVLSCIDQKNTFTKHPSFFRFINNAIAIMRASHLSIT